MTVVVLLLGYLLVVERFLTPRLARAKWVRRSPRAGVIAWQGLSFSALATLYLGLVAITLPAWQHAVDLPAFIDTCVLLLEHRYLTPLGEAGVTVAFALFLSLTARLVGTALVQSRRTRRARRAHTRHLGLIAERDTQSGFDVVDHCSPMAYCLPGRGGGRVVFTSAALALLDAEQIAAVARHERAHLSGRHHLALLTARVLHAALPRIRTLAVAGRELPVLVEMCADDAVRSPADRLTLATALLSMRGQVPEAALGAVASPGAQRVERLLTPRSSGPRWWNRLAPLLVLVPIAIVTMPAATAAIAPYCPLPAS